MPHRKKGGQSGKKGGSLIDEVLNSPEQGSSSKKANNKSGKGKQKK